jgi:molecular chaperone GrpE
MTDQNLNDEQKKECCGNCQDCDCKKDDAKPQDKADEYLNNWKRERADFINYKKDELERTLSLIKHSTEKFVIKLLPILDNVYLAQAHLKDDGLAQIVKQFEEFLKKEGIEPIETEGKQFDPTTMDILEEVESDNANPDFVAEEVQKGYIINGKVLRPAKVKIAK